MALLEPVDGQAKQAAGDVGRQAIAHGGARQEQHKGSQQGRPGVDQSEKSKPQRQDGQQIVIQRGQRLINGKLHVVG